MNGPHVLRAGPDWMADTDRAAYRTLMEIWMEFMAGGDHSIGWKSRDALLASEGALDSEQLYSRADYQTYLAVDGCIDSLLPLERQAIYIAHRQSHFKVFRSPRFSFPEMLRMAEKSLLAKLKKNHCTAIKFS